MSVFNFAHKVAVLRESIDQSYESLSEFEAQYHSECAMFGDAGPGQYLTIQRIKSDIRKEEAVLTSLMNTPIGKALKAFEQKKHEAYIATLTDDDLIPF